MRNHEVTAKKNLLDSEGHLVEPGWSRSLVQIYERQQIKAPKWRIKEWDYYFIQSKDYVLCLTISDNGYMGLESVSLINLKTKWQHTESLIIPFPMGKLNLPSSSKRGHAHFKNKRVSLSFLNDGKKRRLLCEFKKFYEGLDFTCDILLEEIQEDSLVVATPWDNNPKAFYYNQKINNLTASGVANLGDEIIPFDAETSFATLDWGRGVWTYDNTWYWGSGNGEVDGKIFGFNLGYGFGNTQAASENIIYYDGVSHKLEDIEFIHESDYMKPWEITSSDQRFEGNFKPLLDRAALTDLKVIVSDQHQVFGHFSGRVILDNGEELNLVDFFCFFEKVHNKF